MKILYNLVFAMIIAIVFASCGSKKTDRKQQDEKKYNGSYQKISQFPPFLISSDVVTADFNSDNRTQVYGYTKKYDTLRSNKIDTISVYQSQPIFNGYWRTLGHSISTDSVQSLEEAKSYAYYQLMIEAIYDMYPMLFEFYDDSFVDNNTSYTHIIHNEKSDTYESYVVVEIPQQVLKTIIDMTIEGQQKYWEKVDYEIYDGRQGETKQITTYYGYGKFSIIENTDSQKNRYYGDTEIPYLNDMIREYNYNKTYENDTLLMEQFDHSKFEEHMKECMEEYMKKDTINN